MKENKVLQTYFHLMLSSGSIALYNYVQENNLLNDYSTDEKFTVEDFAKKHDYVIGPTAAFLNSLVSLGLLEKDGDCYHKAAVMDLLKGNYRNLSVEYWEHLPVLLKTGTPYKKMDAVADTEKEYQVQVKSLEWMMTPCAEWMADAIIGKNPAMKNDKELQILDVGAGSGVWSFHFLYKLPFARVTLADWPAVLMVAKDTAMKKKISERVMTIEGNFHENAWPKEKFQVVTLGNVTHILSAKDNKNLFKKIYESMSPGGQLIILDAYGKIPEGELARALYQMGLTIRTIQGKVFSPEEMRPWLIDAGFKDFDFQSLEAVPYSMGMYIAKK